MENYLNKIGNILGFTVKNDAFCLNNNFQLSFEDFLGELDFNRKPNELATYKAFWKLLCDQVRAKADRYTSDQLAKWLGLVVDKKQLKAALIGAVLCDLAQRMMENIEQYSPKSGALKKTQANAFDFFCSARFRQLDKLDGKKLTVGEKSMLRDVSIKTFMGL